MDFYRTKGELLVSQNKDRGDTRWVDRQMLKGVIGHCEDGYYFIMDYLREENEMLRRKLKEKGEEKSGGVTMQEVEDCAIDLREHLIYVRKRLDHVNSCIDLMVQNYFKKNQQSMDFDSAQSKLYSIIKYVPDPNEKEERQLAIDNGLDLE